MLYEGGEIDAHPVSLAQMTNSSTTVQLRNAAPLLYSICWQQFRQVMDKKINHLRTFFRVSNIAFDCVMAMRVAFGGKSIVSPMHQLHKLALIEIEKENPDLSIIDNLLEEMEKLAESNSQPKPNFPKGGV